MPEILLIDDNRDILAANSTLFRRQGFHVAIAETGIKAVTALNEKQFDCIVLDILLPDLDGYTICKAARTITDTPIIFLTCLDELDEKVKGLMSGGDDYLTKPYNLEELAARVQALMRRTHKNNGYTSNSVDFYLDRENRMLHVSNKNIFFSRKEFELFLLLYEHPGQIFSKEELLEKVWGIRGKNKNTVTVHIMRLRRKLESVEECPGWIESAYGAGYHFVMPEGDDS